MKCVRKDTAGKLHKIQEKVKTMPKIKKKSYGFLHTLNFFHVIFFKLCLHGILFYHEFVLLLYLNLYIQEQYFLFLCNYSFNVYNSELKFEINCSQIQITLKLI